MFPSDREFEGCFVCGRKRNKMDYCLLMFVVSLSALISCVSSQSCEQSYYERCLKELIDFTDQGGLIFEPNELQEECVQAQSALGCLTRYSKKCLPPEQRSKFMEDISGPQKLTIGLCTDETDFRSRYIKNLSCLRNMSSDLQHCKEMYDRNQKDIILVEYEDKTHLQCCSFDGYRRCLRMHANLQEDCGEGTIDVIEEFANRLGGVLTEDVCADHFVRCIGVGAGVARIAHTSASVLLSLLASCLTGFVCLHLWR